MSVPVIQRKQSGLMAVLLEQRGWAKSREDTEQRFASDPAQADQQLEALGALSP